MNLSVFLFLSLFLLWLHFSVFFLSLQPFHVHARTHTHTYTCKHMHGDARAHTHMHTHTHTFSGSLVSFVLRAPCILFWLLFYFCPMLVSFSLLCGAVGSILCLLCSLLSCFPPEHSREVLHLLKAHHWQSEYCYFVLDIDNFLITPTPTPSDMFSVRLGNCNIADLVSVVSSSHMGVGGSLLVWFLSAAVSNRPSVTLGWPCKCSMQEIFIGDMFCVNYCEQQTNCNILLTLWAFLAGSFTSDLSSVSNRPTVTLYWPCEWSMQEVFTGDMFSVNYCEQQASCNTELTLWAFRAGSVYWWRVFCQLLRVSGKL